MTNISTGNEQQYVIISFNDVLFCVPNTHFLARRNLDRHYSNTIGHPRSYSAVATYSLPYDPTNGEPDPADLKRQLQRNLGYPKGVRYDIFFILKGHILQPMTYWWQLSIYFLFRFSFGGYREVEKGILEIRVKVSICMGSKASLEIMEDLRQHSNTWTPTDNEKWDWWYSI